MVKVEFNKKSVNPFYGMSNTLEIFQEASKGLRITNLKLEKSWSEAKTIEQKAIVFSILFFVGDVTGRQHNIFDGKIDSGGNSQREVFRDDLIPFLVSKVKGFKLSQRLRLMNLITEYTTLDNIVANRVKTKKGSTTVVSVIDMISVFGIEDVATYASQIILKGSVFQKMCVAKFITRPRFSKRSGKKKMLTQTIEIMSNRIALLTEISDRCKLPYENKGSYINFSGFYNWRKEFNQNFESVLFSSGKVNDLDKDQFIQLIDNMPSDARFRVRNRVMFNEKWSQLKDWYLIWESFKNDKQAEQRQIETKIINEGATSEDISRLAKVKKEAKVNVGSVSFTKLFSDIVKGTVDKVKVQPFLDKINLPYNTLVFVDDSGSMTSHWGSDYGFSARQFAAFMATIVLSKNPDVEARNLVGLFSSHCRLFNGVSNANIAPNSLLAPKVIKTAKRSLINSEDHFLENQSNFQRFMAANQIGHMTDISSVFREIGDYALASPNNAEELARYPIWTFISDGNFNNKRSVEASISDFLRRTEDVIGFKPFILLIDVARNTSAEITRFEGLDNVMVIPPNPANIEMLLTNFKDMDTYDVYTPLLSLSRTNRYAPVRKFVEESFGVKVEKLQKV